MPNNVDISTYICIYTMINVNTAIYIMLYDARNANVQNNRVIHFQYRKEQPFFFTILETITWHQKEHKFDLDRLLSLKACIWIISLFQKFQTWTKLISSLSNSYTSKMDSKCLTPVKRSIVLSIELFATYILPKVL